MDPEVTYQEMMAAHDAIDRLMMNADPENEHWVSDLADEVEILHSRLRALDEWLRKGGFKPKVWAGDAPSVWDPTVPPGGHVCGACGMPVESVPCEEHQPGAWAAVDR